MTCGTCGSIERVNEVSLDGSYEVRALAWVHKKLREIARVASYSHVRRCPDCGTYYTH